MSTGCVPAKGGVGSQGLSFNRKQRLWTLAFAVASLRTRLDFFPWRRDAGNPRADFHLNKPHHTTVPRVWVHKILFLRSCGRVPLATLTNWVSELLPCGLFLEISQTKTIDVPKEAYFGVASSAPLQGRAGLWVVTLVRARMALSETRLLAEGFRGRTGQGW